LNGGFPMGPPGIGPTLTYPRFDDDSDDDEGFGHQSPSGPYPRTSGGAPVYHDYIENDAERAKFFANRVKTIRTKAETFATCTGTFRLSIAPAQAHKVVPAGRGGGAHRGDRREWRLPSLGHLIVRKVSVTVCAHSDRDIAAGSWRTAACKS